MGTTLERVAKIAAGPLGCAHDDVRVRREAVPWIRRMRAYRARGPVAAQPNDGFLVTMPFGAPTPPLVFAAEPVWDQLWYASALLRVEELDGRVVPPPLFAEICRVTLAGPGGKLATPELARRELRAREAYDTLAPALINVDHSTKKKEWRICFTWIAPDGAVEGWAVNGSEYNVVKAGCQLMHPPDSWPMSRS